MSTTALERMRAKVPRMALGGVDTDKILQMLAVPYEEIAAERQLIRRAITGDRTGFRWLDDMRPAWMGMVRPADWSDEEFDLWIRVRSASNQARGTRPRILDVCAVLCGKRGSRVFAAPKAVTVSLVSLPSILVYPHIIDIAKTELLRSVSETSELAIIVDELGVAFTWDVENLGWDQGVWIDPL